MNNIIRVILLLALIASGCRGIRETYWVNHNYDPSTLRERFTLDTARCTGEARTAYADPRPIYGTCSSANMYALLGIQEGVYVDQSASGRFEGRTDRGQTFRGTYKGDASACSIQLMNAINDKIREKQNAERNREQYLSSCMSVLGWQRQLATQ